MSLRLLWGGVGRTPCCFLHRGRSALQVSRHKTWSIRQRQNSIRLNGRRAIVCLLMYFHERLVLYPCLCSYTYVCMYVRLCSSVCLKTSTASNPGSDFIRSLLLGFQQTVIIAAVCAIREGVRQCMTTADVCLPAAAEPAVELLRLTLVLCHSASS